MRPRAVEVAHCQAHGTGAPADALFVHEQPKTSIAINPPVTTQYIPFVNIAMDFNISPATFTYQLAQQIAQVVLGGVPASSYLDATIYDEEGATPQSTTIRITAKFYDGDTAQVNALAATASNLVCLSLKPHCLYVESALLVLPW